MEEKGKWVTLKSGKRVFISDDKSGFRKQKKEKQEGIVKSQSKGPDKQTKLKTQGDSKDHKLKPKTDEGKDKMKILKGRLIYNRVPPAHLNIESYGGGTSPAESTGNDSLSKHTDSNGRLTPEREALHQQIINSYFEKAKPVGPDEDQIFTVMGGGSAAGKSTMLKTGAAKIPENGIKVDSDEIKELLPEFREMIESGQGDKAAGYVHEESSALTKRIMELAMNNRFNMTLDGTGDGSLKSLSSKIEQARKKGMKVEGIYATCSIEEAMRRNLYRAEKTGRLVPPNILIATHQKVSDILPQAVELFDSVKLYDTHSFEKAVMIAEGGKGLGWNVKGDRQLEYENFIKKGKELNV